MRHTIPACVLSIALLACDDRQTATGPVAAAVKVSNGPIIRHSPGDSPGIPVYALLGRGFMPSDDGWVGIVFIRSPQCVPAGFNLLDEFNPPTAWACDLTVEGTEWWHDVSTPPPYQTHERGMGAVPIYFVALSELQAATADGVLTIGELKSLPSLVIGYATFFHHIVHNTNQPTNHGHETLVAHGELTDGRTFQFRYNEKFLPETGEHVFPNVKISFE